MIRDKLSSAGVVFPEDIDPRIVTLNSRVMFRVNDGPPDTRVVVHGRENNLVGVTIPILIPRGLALLGMAEGQEGAIHGPDHPDRIQVDRVAFQPEAARRALMEGISPDGRPREGLRPFIPAARPCAGYGIRRGRSCRAAFRQKPCETARRPGRRRRVRTVGRLMSLRCGDCLT